MYKDGNELGSHARAAWTLGNPPLLRFFSSTKPQQFVEKKVGGCCPQDADDVNPGVCLYKSPSLGKPGFLQDKHGPRTTRNQHISGDSPTQNKNIVEAYMPGEGRSGMSPIYQS